LANVDLLDAFSEFESRELGRSVKERIERIRERRWSAAGATARTVAGHATAFWYESDQRAVR